MELSSTSQLLIVFYITTVGYKQTDATCDPHFKSSVEKCLRLLHGFPVLTRQKVLLPGDWVKTDVICKWQLVRVTSLCVSSVYASCPKVKTWRTLCGFQSVDPDQLLQYGDIICRHKEVLKQHSACLNRSLCSLRSCLKNFDPIVPGRLSTGMWKPPQYSHYCSYQAYAEHCHEKTLLTSCPEELASVQLHVLNATRPSACSWLEIERLKQHFRDSEPTVIINSGCFLVPSCSCWGLSLLLAVLGLTDKEADITDATLSLEETSGLTSATAKEKKSSKVDAERNIFEMRNERETAHHKEQLRNQVAHQHVLQDIARWKEEEAKDRCGPTDSHLGQYGIGASLLEIQPLIQQKIKENTSSAKRKKQSTRIQSKRNGIKTFDRTKSTSALLRMKSQIKSRPGTTDLKTNTEKNTSLILPPIMATRPLAAGNKPEDSSPDVTFRVAYWCGQE